jgi:hypothetical protein
MSRLLASPRNARFNIERHVDKEVERSVRGSWRKLAELLQGWDSCFSMSWDLITWPCKTSLKYCGGPRVLAFYSGKTLNSPVAGRNFSIGELR